MTAMEHLTQAYSPKEPRPLGGYAVLMGAYVAMVGAFAAKARGARTPYQLGWGDLALVAVGTQRGARLITRDKVTAVLRAPFTRFKDFASEGEVDEEPRGEGLQLAVGELLTCPWCTGQWVATALVGGLVIAPRATRLLAGTLTALAAADVLQDAYSVVQTKADRAVQSD